MHWNCIKLSVRLRRGLTQITMQRIDRSRFGEMPLSPTPEQPFHSGGLSIGDRLPCRKGTDMVHKYHSKFILLIA